MDITNFIRDGVTYPIGDTKSRESIATAFDSTASYSAGDYAMYDGTLYKFTSSHSGEWNPSHAEATCVTDELGSSNAQVMYYYQQPVNTATNAEILRITSGKINTDTVVLECTFADPSYITSDVTWTSYEGYIAFTGTCTTATTANVTMAYKTENSISDRLLTLLWENPSPSSSFAVQTINLDLSNYEKILIETRYHVNSGWQYNISRNICDVNATETLQVVSTPNSNSMSYTPQTAMRHVSISDIGVTIQAGLYKNLTNSSAFSNDNNYCIPLKIYGISKNITIKTSEFVRKEYDTATTANSNLTGEFNKYASIDISEDVTKYGIPISLYVDSDDVAYSSINPTMIKFSGITGKTIQVYSKNAQSMKIRAVYMN